MAAGQAKRKTKTSQGRRRSSAKVKLTELQKALLGGGPIARIKPL